MPAESPGETLSVQRGHPEQRSILGSGAPVQKETLTPKKCEELLVPRPFTPNYLQIGLIPPPWRSISPSWSAFILHSERGVGNGKNPPAVSPVSLEQQKAELPLVEDAAPNWIVSSVTVKAAPLSDPNCK